MHRSCGRKKPKEIQHAEIVTGSRSDAIKSWHVEGGPFPPHYLVVKIEAKDGSWSCSGRIHLELAEGFEVFYNLEGMKSLA